MKRIRTLLLCGTILTALPFVTSAVAQDDTSSQRAAIGQRSPDEVVDTMAAKLNLTEDQKNKIRPIIAERQQKLQELRADTSMRQFKKARKAKGIFSDSDKKINAVLTDEQKKQYAEMKQQMKEEIQERMQNRKAQSAGGSQQ